MEDVGEFSIIKAEQFPCDPDIFNSSRVQKSKRIEEKIDINDFPKKSQNMLLCFFNI